MKKSLRLLSLIIAAVFMISGALLVVCHAEEGDGGSGGGAVDGGSGGVVDGGGGSGDGAVDGGSGGGAVDGGSGGGAVDYSSDGSDDYSGYDSDYSGGYSSDDYSGSVDDSDRLYYGDASQYSYNINADSNESAAGSVSSSLYNTSGMSAAEAAPNEWSDITLDEKTIQTGVTDFSAIKENTEVEDNGYWILYIGYTLLGLAALGILYFIIATLAHRSAVRKAERLEQRRRASSYPSRSAAARMEERERREYEPTYHRTSRFADENPGYSRRASSRSDTGEVYVPRRVAKR